MGNTSSSRKITAQDRAILEMKSQRDKLHQYQERITGLTARETAIARACLARGQRDRALLALRRKKYQESLLAQTDAQLEQLQKLTGDVEFAAVQKDVLYGIQQGTAVLKQIHAEMGGLADVEKLLEETAEARAYQAEVSEMLRGQISTADEEDVEAELAAMERRATTGGGVQKTDLPDVSHMQPLPASRRPEREATHAEEEERADTAAEAILA